MRMSYFFLLLIGVLVTACTTTNAPAPVSEIAVKPAPPVTSNKIKPEVKSTKAPDKDWRPDNYVVKKGDTLYSIGLEHGFDYKEIAQLNQIEAPAYTIKVGQTLKLTDLKAGVVKAKPVEKKVEEAVVTKPLGADSFAPKGKPLEEPVSAKPVQDNTPTNEKSDSAAIETTAAVATTATVAASPNVPSATPTPTPAAPTATASPSPARETPDINDKLASQSRPGNNVSSTASSAGFDWAWPAKGKITNPFSEGGNAKGIDIEGTMGQEVYAAASGKVIYNGGDLRGYGNMIIIKHDKDFLSVYAHNSKTTVKEGQSITKGQKIAEMGSSGTDKVKLHFEIRFQGKSVDPVKYLGNLP